MRIVPVMAWANAVSWATMITAHSGRPRRRGHRWAARAQAPATALATISAQAIARCQSSVALAITGSSVSASWPDSISTSPAGVVSTMVTEVLSRLRMTIRSSPSAGADHGVDGDEVRHDDGVDGQRAMRSGDAVAVGRVPRTERRPRPGHRLAQPRHPLPHRHARRRRDLGHQRRRSASRPTGRPAGPPSPGSAAGGS